MDVRKIGKFIAECRKKKEITQKELADQLGVTDKSVSKWERGINLPESGLLIPLCDCLDIQVQELLLGEYLSKDELLDKSDSIIVDLVSNDMEGAFFTYKMLCFFILLPVISVFLMSGVLTFLGDFIIIFMLFAPFTMFYGLAKMIQRIIQKKDYFRYFLIASWSLFFIIVSLTMQLSQL